MTGTIREWIHRLGAPGLILPGIADNTPFISAPAGSVDVFVILLAAHRPEWWANYALIATVGEVLGGYLTYHLAQRGGHETLERKVGKRRAEEIYRRFEKHGVLTVLIGSILPPPFPFTSVLMAAGVMQYPCKNFLSALTAGRGALLRPVSQSLWLVRSFTVAVKASVLWMSMDQARATSWSGYRPAAEALADELAGNAHK